MAKAIHFSSVSINATDDEIRREIATMRRLREIGFKDVLVRVEDYFIPDYVKGGKGGPWDLTIVQHICRQMVELGMIPYLSPDSSAVADPMAKDYWGALQVWLCGKNRLTKKIDRNKALMDEFSAFLAASGQQSE